MAQIRKVITKINRYLYEEEASYIKNVLKNRVIQKKCFNGL